MRTSRRPSPLGIFFCLLLAGCRGDNQPSEASQDPDLLYPFATPRHQIIQKRPGTGLRTIVETLPDDEFLIATVRQMLAQGMARPTYYERFPVLGTAGAVQEYVFYDRHQCVMYVARRT